MTTPKPRIGNSILFREVNERISQLSDSWHDGEPRELLCECADVDCTEPIAVTRADYEATRARPGRFLVSAGHVDATSSVVETHEGYAAVEYAKGLG